MTDIFDKKKRSEIMSKIKGKNTKPELVISKLLKGTSLKKHPKITGNPDFGDKKNKIAIFVDGCFWHGCEFHGTIPKTNRTFWRHKIGKNIERDIKINKILRHGGYKVIRIWEHEIKKDKEWAAGRIKRLLKKSCP